jgi:hypothetical protein
MSVCVTWQVHCVMVPPEKFLVQCRRPLHSQPAIVQTESLTGLSGTASQVLQPWHGIVFRLLKEFICSIRIQSILSSRTSLRQRGSTVRHQWCHITKVWALLQVLPSPHADPICLNNVCRPHPDVCSGEVNFTEPRMVSLPQPFTARSLAPCDSLQTNGQWLCS